MVRIQIEARDDDDGPCDERDEGKAHVGVVDAPSAVAGRVHAAAEQKAVGAAADDEDGAGGRRRDVEAYVCRQRHSDVVSSRLVSSPLSLIRVSVLVVSILLLTSSNV